MKTKSPILPYNAFMPRLIFLSLRAERGNLGGGVKERANIPGSFRGALAPLKKLSSPFPLIRGRGTKGDRVT
jgi:hypothetical protein